ncbi:MAG: tRNA (guanosine(46)-N7)-methyltransferase TrmB [Spirochaetales bacterium]|jgi:tRNA (guanine-N7-)-methyltransferase|nr:tRNA (guanosine(46)-N7)-methyltransferase TrmB [Spirochaetales bacterium]
MIESPEKPPGRREIKSYVRHERRFTPTALARYRQLYSRYGLDPGGENWPAELLALWPRVILEIGFGMGTATLRMAAGDPERLYLGAEVFLPGILRLLKGADQEGIPNLRVIRGDGKETLKDFPESTLEGLHLFFPDPWPKKRHHKRRLVRGDFAELVCSRLKPGGYFLCLTDWEEYAGEIQALFRGCPGMTGPEGPGAPARPETEFEKKGRAAGRRIWEIYLRKASEI